MSTPDQNAISLPQTRKWFNNILVNAKIYDLRDSGLLEKKRFNRVSKKTANDMRMKRFLKNEDGKKHKRGDILNYYIKFNIPPHNNLTYYIRR